MVNLEAVQAVITAARSGKYQQCKGYLRCGDGFCFLGMVTDVFDQLHPGAGKWEASEKLGEVLVYKYFNPIELRPRQFTSVLPLSVTKWLGLDDGDELWILRDAHSYETEVYSSLSVTDLNDDAGLTFSQIADVLEWYYRPVEQRFRYTYQVGLGFLLAPEDCGNVCDLGKQVMTAMENMRETDLQQLEDWLLRDPDAQIPIALAYARGFFVNSKAGKVVDLEETRYMINIPAANSIRKLVRQIYREDAGVMS